MNPETFYHAIIAYDGTDCDGWQVQPSQKTVAGILQDVFKKVFGQTIRIIGASRTDAGVHAHGQHARFACSLNIDPEVMRYAWNMRLPGGITIRELKISSPDFHPLYRVLRKEYWYRFSTFEVSPFLARYCVVNKKCDLILLHKTLQLFMGTHDFRPFSSGVEKEKNTIRSIESIRIIAVGKTGRYCILIRGKSFIRFMVRRIVGAAFAVASGCVDISYVHKVLHQGIIDNGLPVAPAKGLLLRSIVYHESDLK